jgi:hypothetical protein
VVSALDDDDAGSCQTPWGFVLVPLGPCGVSFSPPKMKLTSALRAWRCPKPRDFQRHGRGLKVSGQWQATSLRRIDSIHTCVCFLCSRTPQMEAIAAAGSASGAVSASLCLLQNQPRELDATDGPHARGSWKLRCPSWIGPRCPPALGPHPHQTQPPTTATRPNNSRSGGAALARR